MSDWVQVRARRELDLEAHARQFWEAFALACETAVVQYERFYQHRPTEARFERVNRDGLAVHLTLGVSDPVTARTQTIAARFDQRTKTITSRVGVRPVSQARIERDATGQLVAVLGDRRYTPDALSQVLLEPYFFPKDEAPAPREPADSCHLTTEGER